MKRCNGDIPASKLLEAIKGHTYEHTNGDVYIATKIKDRDHLILVNLLTGTPWSSDFTFGAGGLHNFTKVDYCFKKEN